MALALEAVEESVNNEQPKLDLEPVEGGKAQAPPLDLEPVAEPSRAMAIPEPGIVGPQLSSRGVLSGPTQAFAVPEQRHADAIANPVPELTAQEAETLLTTPAVTLPRPGEPGTVTRGLSELGAGLVEQTLLTPAAPILDLATAIPEVRVATGVLLSAAAAKSAAEKAGEFSVTGNRQSLTEAIGLGTMAALGAAGSATESFPAKVEPSGTPPPSTEAAINDLAARAPATADAIRTTTETLKPELVTEGLSSVPKEQTPATPIADATIAPPEISTGPGAASPGDFPSETELKQLTTAIEPTEPVKPPLLDQLSRDIAATRSELSTKTENTIATLKSLGTSAMNALRGVHTWTDFKDTLGKYSGSINRNDFELQQFTHEIKRVMPDRTRREAIVNWLQADGDPAVLASRAAATTDRSLKKGYEAASELTPDEITLAGNVRSYLDSKLQEGIDAGLLKAGIEDYVSQIWRRPNPISNKLMGEAASGKLSPNFKFARQRIFDSYFEGEQAGYKPRIKDIGALISIYDQSFSRAIAARNLLKSLHEGTAKDGRPLVEVSGVSNLLAESGSPEALLIKPKARPEDIGDYKPIDHPALRGWKWAGKDEATGTPILYQGDLLVHPEVHTHLKNVLSTSALRQNAFFRGLLATQSVLKQSKLALSGFHFTQEATHAASHRVNPLAPDKIDFTIPDQSALVDHGLQVADYRAYQSFTEGLGGTGSIYERTPIVGKWLTRYNEYLFQEYIPRLKMTMAMDALGRNRERYGTKLNEDQILELTSNQANAAFGQLNYTMLGRNQTLQDFLRLAALAPDFLEARGRFATQSLTGTGREQRVALALQAATLYVGARILNQAIDGDPHWEPKYAFSIIANKRQYGIRSVVEDTAHFITDPSQFIGNRLAPFARAATEFVTGRNWRGVKRTAIQQVADVAEWLLPISVDKQPQHTRMDQALAASGVTVRSATATKRLYDVLSDFKKANNLQTADEIAGQISPSEYAPLRSALLSGDEKEARRAYDALLKPDAGAKPRTPQQIRSHFITQARAPFGGSARVEKQFLRSLDKKGNDLYLEARKERQELAVAFVEAQKRWMAKKP